MSTTTQPPKPKRRWYQFSLLTLLVALTLACVGFALLQLTLNPNSTEVRNSSGVPIDDVRLELSYTDYYTGHRFIERGVSLQAGESTVLWHSMNDSFAELRFTLGETQHQHEAYLDLWTGQRWLFDIQPDGTVKEGYEHGMLFGGFAHTFCYAIASLAFFAFALAYLFVGR